MEPVPKAKKMFQSETGSFQLISRPGKPKIDKNHPFSPGTYPRTRCIKLQGADQLGDTVESMPFQILDDPRVDLRAD